MSCAGNNYKQILSKYPNVLNNPTCVYDNFYGMCDDNMDIITVLRHMIDVRDGFKTCTYYTVTTSVLAGAAGRALGAVISKFKSFRNDGYNAFSIMYELHVVPVIDHSAGV